MDSPIIFQILLALVALFFIFLTYMNTKTWRWLHVTITIFLFIACIPFAVYAAMTLKTRLAWVGHVDKLEKEVATTSADVERLTYGDPGDLEDKSESVVDLRANVARTILDRGRVWRGVTMLQPQGDGYVIAMSPPQDPAVPAAAPASPHKIEPKTVLFAFKEGPTPDGVSVPRYYLGEFQVTAAADATITINPLLPLTDQQRAVAQDPNPITIGLPPPQPGEQPQQPQPATWALYEVMPVDGHEWLSGKTEEELRALFPQQLLGLAQPQYEQFLAQFLRDGQQADEVSDPPDNVWYEVKFTQAYKITVDAAGGEPIDSAAFDAQGRAQIDRLRRAAPGEPPAELELAVGETAIVSKPVADQLVADGVAEKVRPIYRRKLTDFEVKLHGVHEQIVELNGHIRALSLDVAAIQKSKERADAQATLLEDYRSQLTEDLGKVKFELDELTKYGTAVAGRLSEVRGELSQLYRSNKALSRELAALNAQLTEEIEGRTRSSTARAN